MADGSDAKSENAVEEMCIGILGARVARDAIFGITMNHEGGRGLAALKTKNHEGGAGAWRGVLVSSPKPRTNTTGRSVQKDIAPPVIVRYIRI